MFLSIRQDARGIRPALSLQRRSPKRPVSRRKVAIPTFTPEQWDAVNRFLKTKHGKKILEHFAARGMELEGKRLRELIAQSAL